MDYEQKGVRIARVLVKAGLEKKAADFAGDPAIVRAMQQCLKPSEIWTNGPVSPDEVVSVRKFLSTFPLADGVLQILTNPVHLGEVRAILYEPSGRIEM